MLKIKIAVVGPTKVNSKIPFLKWHNLNIDKINFQGGKTTLSNFLADAGDSIGADYTPTIGCRYVKIIIFMIWNIFMFVLFFFSKNIRNGTGTKSEQ